MFYLIELYSPKPSWLALSYDERLDFFHKVQVGMMRFDHTKIEMVAMGKVDEEKPYAAPRRFFAIWRMSEESSLNTLIEGIRAVGWHDFFETVNAAGSGGNMPAHLQELAVS